MFLDIVATEWIMNFVGWLFNFAFIIPFQVPFFMFPFSFGHLIYGSMIINLACYVVAKLVKGEKKMNHA